MSTQITNLSNLDQDKVDLLKRTICKGASDDELQLFIHACNHTQLDPFMRQIYAVKRNNIMTIQTGIDGYRLIAERTGRYMPGKESTFIYGEKGELFSATAYVKKMDSKGDWHEIAATAHFIEYNARNQMWAKMPCCMLSKCAEALCLRKSFPADLSGLYTKEEMEQADEEPLPMITNEPTKLFPREIITSEEAQAIEEFIFPEDKGEYRENLLKYLTTITKSKEPMKDFSSLPKDCHEKCMRSVLRKHEERLKQKKESSKEDKPMEAEIIEF
jgi:phage recombination protein Bet